MAQVNVCGKLAERQARGEHAMPLCVRQFVTIVDQFVNFTRSVENVSTIQIPAFGANGGCGIAGQQDRLKRQFTGSDPAQHIEARTKLQGNVNDDEITAARL